jgi:hypothetical protein
VPLVCRWQAKTEDFGLVPEYLLVSRHTTY